MPAEVEVYDKTHPKIFWLNSRPLFLHGVLGEGGFGTVWKVEMLVPFGLKVGRDANGGLIFNEEGCVAVHRSDVADPFSTDATAKSSPAPALGGGDTSGGRDEGSEKTLREQALKVSEPSPLSMSYFQLVDDDTSVDGALSSGGKTPIGIFFRVESLSASREQAKFAGTSSNILPDPAILDRETDLQAGAGVGGDQLDGGGDGVIVAAQPEYVMLAADTTRVGGEQDVFGLASNDRLYGSGAFFALKVQAAKSKKQLEDFSKEVDNCHKVRGSANVVQIMDHALMWGTLHLAILMELGACDLLGFLKHFKWCLGVSDVSRVWNGLLRAVDAAHGQDIIHRDLKPQNFLLVPVASPFADRILATTSTRPEKFQFRFVDDDGDVALALRDSWTGHEAVLRLVIKLSDFGLAQPLELEESHLSVHGHAGTLKYMAPETVQPTTEDCRRKLSKRVDIWALGIMLFQMLHNGRTPFDSFFKKGDIEAAVAIASKVVHEKVVKFERATVWVSERQKVEAGHSASTSSRAAIVSSKSVDMVSAWLRTEVLFRMCERCLAFEVADRAEAADLIRWADDFAASENWEERISDSDYLRNDSPGVDVETLASTPNDEMEKEFFPKELRRCVVDDIVGNAVVGTPSSAVQNETPISGTSAGAIGGADVVDKGEARTSTPAML